MNENLSLHEQFILQIQSIIDSNISNENFSVEDLAKQVGLSRSMLHRKLIKLTGKSASDLITSTRLHKAKEMIEKDVGTVSEIAYNVGFKSPSYFNKVFKKRYSVSPGEMKKSYQRNSRSLSVVFHQRLFEVLRNKRTIVLFSVVTIVVIISLVAVSIYNHREKSIAVLPLSNLTGQAENDFFTAGLHDALIGALGNINNLRVISRTSTLRYRDSNMLLKDIANELSVNVIVEASLLKVADSVKLLIQVIDVFPRENHILAAEYNDALENILKIQSSVVKDIAKKINIRLSEKLEKEFNEKRTIKPEVYKAYLRGMYHIGHGTPEEFKKGVAFLMEAIDQDPADPFAYAALALGYALVGHGQFNSKESFNIATAAAKKALEIDPNIDKAHIALAMLHLYKSWDWEKAGDAFKSAILQNPNNDMAHAHYAWYHVLYNDLEKASYHGEKATEISPLSVAFSAWLSFLYLGSKDYDKAEYWAQKALKLKEKSLYANMVMGMVHLHRNNYDEAIAYHEKLPLTNYCKMMRGYVYLKTGQKDKALELWEELEKKAKTRNVSACYRGFMAAYLGYTDEAFKLLNEAIDKKQYPIAYVNFYPYTENIRNDARFGDLLRKMNLPYGEDLIASK